MTHRLMQVRTLLYNGAGVPRDLIRAIAIAKDLSLESLLPFQGRPLRALSLISGNGRKTRVAHSALLD